MDLSLRLPKTDRECLLVLAFVYLITRLPLLAFLPLMMDENVYAMIVQEQLRNPTLVPTFLGYAVSWKPILVFWVYAGFSKLLSSLLPLEIVYRLPSLLFGLLALPPLYFLLKNTGSTRLSAFFTTLILTLSMVSIYSQASFLTDSLLFLLICASLWLYTEKKLPAWRFLAAGALAFAAFFVKLVIAFIIPALAVAYFYTKRREVLSNPLFLLSLLAVPAAFVLHFALLQSLGLAGELYLSDIGGHLLSSEGLKAEEGQALGAIITFISTSGIWFALSFYGFWKYWKSEPFMAFWCVLLVFPLLTGFFMPWYFLPVMPAVAFFATAALLRWEGKEKPDRFFMIVLSMVLVLGFAMMLIYYPIFLGETQPGKDAGLLLAGKENVLVIGTYEPGIIAYKTLAEQRTSGSSPDFGWILSYSNLSRAEVLAYLSDYHSTGYPVVDGSFSSMFISNATFRKDSNLTSFDYVAVVGSPGMELPGYSVIYNKSDVTVYAK